MENVVKYTRKLPFQPEQEMFSAKYGNSTYHSDKREAVECWLINQKEYSEYDIQRGVIRDKAINSFFEGTTTSKD
jgi:hypothetical protein